MQKDLLFTRSTHVDLVINIASLRYDVCRGENGIDGSERKVDSSGELTANVTSCVGMQES